MLGLVFVTRYLKNIIDTKDDDAARNVVNTTVRVLLSNASTLPGLNPNQPIQRSRIEMASHPLLALIGVFGLSLRPLLRSSLHI